MADASTVSKRVIKVLAGPRYKLMPFVEEHISERYISWLNDPEVNRFLEVRFVPQTRETVLAYVRSFYLDTERYMWGIYPNGKENPIGTATLDKIQRHHGSCGLGLMIGEREYWGKGAGEEALRQTVDFAFETLGLRRAWAETWALNHGVHFTFKRLGFTLEGKRREAFFLPPNGYVDQFSWGILAEEWRARR